MKTLIIYASKHGSVETCSSLLQSELNGDITRINIKREPVPDLTLFDTVIIGGAIYAGKIQKEIHAFCVKNEKVLLEKKIGFFICCMYKGEKAEEQLHTSFPQALVSKAIAMKSFGGEFHFKKMNFIEKLMIKMVVKADQNYACIDFKKDISMLEKENITTFAQLVNSK